MGAATTGPTMCAVHPDLRADPRRQLALNPPRLRGWLHAVAAPISVLAGLLLAFLAPTTEARILSAAYSITVSIMFISSATFHRRQWSDAGWWRMRQVDQTAIYLLLGGSYTAIAGAALPDQRTTILAVVWLAILAGIALIWLPFNLPFGLTTGLYIVIGGVFLVWVRDIWNAVGAGGMSLVVAGLLLYFVGGLALGARVPNPIPNVFGYHEVWHVLVVGAAVCHWFAIVVGIFPLYR